jgi:hypothetical protein
MIATIALRLFLVLLSKWNGNDSSTTKVKPHENFRSSEVLRRHNNLLRVEDEALDPFLCYIVVLCRVYILINKQLTKRYDRPLFVKN